MAGISKPLVTEAELMSATITEDGDLEFTRDSGLKINAGQVRVDVTPEVAAARDEAVAAADRAEAVPTTSDTIMASVAANSESAFAAQLNSSIVDQVNDLAPGIIAAEPTVVAAGAVAAELAVTDALAAQRLSYSLVWGTQVNSEVPGIVATGSGTPAFTAAGKFGTCLSGGTVTAGSAGSIPEPAAGEAITIECWMKAAAAPTGASRRVAFSISGQAMYLAAEATTGYASVTLDNNRRWISASNICDGAWHHVAVVLTRSANLTTCTGFWVDGVAAANAASGSPVAAAWSPAGVRVGGLSVSTSFDWQGAGTVGNLDEIRVSSGARYLEAFTPSSAAFAWDSRTLLLAHLDSTTYSEAATVQGYPPRPVGALGGSVAYIGPSQPTDWVKNDQWTEVTV